MLEALLAHAQNKGCYKVILNCSESNIPFYQKCGLEQNEVQMVWPSLQRCSVHEMQASHSRENDWVRKHGTATHAQVARF